MIIDLCWGLKEGEKISKNIGEYRFGAKAEKVSNIIEKMHSADEKVCK